MQNEIQNETLNNKIISYEMKRQHDFENFKKKFHAAYKTFKPIPHFKDTIKDFSQLLDFKNGINKPGITIPSGNIIKNIMFWKSKNLFKILSSVEMKSNPTNLAAKFLNKINFSAIKLFQQIFAKVTKSEKLFSESEIYD